MTETADPQVLTSTEYLVRERASAYRSEFVDGRMVLMTGGSRAHSLIGTNIAAGLHEALRGKPCEVHQRDMRVRVADQNFYTYPDVVVACEPVELEDSHQDTLLNPIVIVEILSPSTAACDRGEKRRRYQGLPSLHDYLVVAQDRPWAEHFRHSGEAWSGRVIEGLDGVIELDTIGATLALRSMYDRVAGSW